MSNAISLEQMSRRYTHPEREGISCGTLHRGDITGWSHATSKPFGSQFRPIRPEVKGCAPISNPCKRLHEYGLAAIEAPHKPEAVCLPGDSKPDPRLDMNRGNIIAHVNDRLMMHAAKARLKVKKPKLEPKKVEFDLLADCPPSDPKALEALKGQVVERDADCVPHTDDPLPYDRPCKANNWRR